MSKLQVFLLNREQVFEIHAKILKFHKSASSEGSRKVYKKYASYSKLAGKIMFFIYIGVPIASVLSPVLVKLITGELILPFGFKLPWFDELSFSGYSVNFLYQLSQAYVFVFGITASDGIYAVEMLHAYCVFDDLCVMLDELNEDLKDKKKKKSPKIRGKIVEIIKKHQDLLKFVNIFIELTFYNNSLFSVTFQ